MRRAADEEVGFLDIPKTVKLSEGIIEGLRRRKLSTGVPISTQMRRAIMRDLESGEPEPQERHVPLFGYIPASPARSVVHLPPGTMALIPPFVPDLPADYALLIVGHSMECEGVANIPDGAYAYFQSREKAFPRNNDIVHVEFEGIGDNDCALAIYKPQPDGSVIFDKCNKNFKPIVKKPGEGFEIRGVYLQSWDGTMPDTESAKAKK